MVTQIWMYRSVLWSQGRPCPTYIVNSAVSKGSGNLLPLLDRHLFVVGGDLQMPIPKCTSQQFNLTRKSGLHLRRGLKC